MLLILTLTALSTLCTSIWCWIPRCERRRLCKHSSGIFGGIYAVHTGNHGYLSQDCIRL